MFRCIPNEGFQLGDVTISNANERADVSLTAINGSSGISAGYSGNIVDSDVDTYWGITADSDNTVILKADKKVRMMEYSLTTAADALDNAQRNWKAWTIYGANFSDDSEAAADSREWKLIAGVVDDNVLRPANSTKFNFTLDTPADSYEYYKIVVTAPSNGEELRMAKFEMKAVAPGTKLTNVNDRFEFTMPDYSVIVSAEFVPESFTINWYDFYNNLIETDENVSAGEYPIFNGSLPATIEINGNQLYFFGWESEEGGWRDGELPSVSKNVDYRPVYLEFPRVNTAESENGTVSPDTDAALPGSTVTVTAAPEPGYHLGDLNVKTVRKEFTDLTALSGSGSSYENLVDGSMDDPSYEGKRGMQWQTDFTGSCYVILKAPCKVAMSNYYLFAGDYNYTGDDRNWKDWTVYGANFENDSQAVRDSSKWQTVHEVTDDTRMTRKNYYYSSNYNLNSTAEPYQYYKIEITASKGADIIRMSEFAMRGVFYVNTVYVDSTTRTFTMPEQNVEMQADVELQAAFEPHTLQGEPVWTCANDYSTASAAFTCSECGETQTFDAAVTSEASGKKTVYTAAVTVNGVEYTDSKTVFHNDFGEDLAGCTLSLSDDIGVNFFMELSEEVVESPNAKMVFTVENGEGKAPQELLVSDIVKNDLYSTAGDSTYYIFSCHVAAKEMNTTIKAKIIDGEEDGDIYEYTVRDYAKTIITDTAGRYSDSTKALVKAMVNYGTAAQTQFGFNTDNPVNLILEESDRVTAPLTEIEKGEITAHNKQITADIKDVNDVTYIGSQLVLLSNTTYRMYFSSGLDKYTVMYNDEEIDPAVSGNSRTITISDISPNQLFEDISLKLTPKSGNAEPVNISLNAADYYYFALKLPTDDSVSNEKAAENSRLINTVTALYRYYNAACDYVADNS